MHNNYYFFRHLSKALENVLQNAVVSECFSQFKDELIVRFETHAGSFFIKASLSPEFSCLSFPENFHRARKNNVDLFPKLIGQRTHSIRQFENERSFAIIFTNSISLLFKMHGNRSNLVLFEHENAVDLFKKNLVADQTITLNTLDRTIDWSYENFLKHHEKLNTIYFTFGKIVWEHLGSTQFDSFTSDQKWNVIQKLKKDLDDTTFYITEWNDKPTLSLFETGSIKKVFNNPITCINEFYYYYTQTFAFQRERSALINVLKGKLNSSENYLKKNAAKLNEIKHDSSYKIWADILMANMHAIKPGLEKVTLEDFYNNNQPIEIRLKKDLSPQKNAEVFYRKSKNQQLEIDRLQQAIEIKEKEILETRYQLDELDKASDLKELRKIKSALSLDDHQEKDQLSLPYHEFEFGKFKIWVGRNAQSNDLLTFKYSYKEDLWLHAKDVTGSHVLIKHQAGKNFPKDVIERAAQLAAYNSKRKNESLCPVVVTPKKFVRKRKGDPAGAVVVEREEVILVEPKL